MLIIKIWGGLGNQLFQYAFGYALAKEKNMQLLLDTTFNDNYDKRKELIKRPQKLSKFNIDYETISQDKLPFAVKLLSNKYINKLIRCFPSFCIPIGGGFKYIKEIKRVYYSHIWELDFENLYADGYWQTQEYFNKYADEIKKQFKVNYEYSQEVKELMEQIQGCNSVAVHIRRTDYVEIAKHDKKRAYADLDFYTRAMDYANKKLENPVYYFFSDDMAWVKDNFKDKSYKYITLKTPDADIDEMMCMAACRNSIIAASTFSWWGAWLKENKDGLIISPKGYFNNYDLIPKEWITV